MKLSRLLVGLISLLWVVVFFATLLVVVHSTRDYLHRTMETHAQDTATSLGFSITQSKSFNDPVTIELMTSAIFDRGYYSEIEVKKLSGESIFKKRVNPAVDKVPDWFIQVFKLPAPRMSAVVMDGWRKAAVVEVESHPGHAYKELWGIAKKSFWVLLAVALISLVVVVGVLRLALRPLDDMERQAIDISKRKFTMLDKLPWATELHRISRALNSMCFSVERMLGEQSALTEKMRQKAYVDSVTGLTNRNDFSEKLSHMIATPEEFGSGALAIVRVNGFAVYNEKNGRAAGDALLQKTAQLLGRVADAREHVVLARMDGPEFALLAPEVSAAELPALGEAMVNALGEIEEFPRTPDTVRAYIGLAHYQHGEGASFGKLMQSANQALEVAHEREQPGWHAFVEAPGTNVAAAAVATQVNTLFAGGIAAGRVQVQYQPVRGCNDQAAWQYRSEALVRVTGDDGALIPAGLFIPAVKRQGLLGDLDRLVVERVIQRIASGGPINGGATAVNLSPESINAAGFIDWLCDQLARQPSVAKYLIFEVSENSIINKIESVKIALHRLRELGVRCCIDRFGQSTASVGFLRSLDIDYIKIDGSYTRGIIGSSDRQFFVQALVGIAHGLGIQVLTEYIESEQEFNVVKSLMVDGAQGYYIGKPV
jgi:diguanylate cyclase (GGDEF)-like protein